MVNKMKLLDKVHLQKYIYLISQFIEGQIPTKEFEHLFINIRREDAYWLSDLFEENLGQILDTLFLDISDYVSNELYDPSDSININDEELTRRVKQAMIKLQQIM